MEIAVIGVIAALCCAVIVLYDRSTDLRWRLKSAESDARRWKDEAVKRGWKNPFEEIADSLKASTEKLEAAAAQMRQTADLQRRNAERLKAVNAHLQEANAALKRQVEHLDKAAEHFRAAGRGLKPGRATVIEAGNGPVETDPMKLN